MCFYVLYHVAGEDDDIDDTPSGGYDERPTSGYDDAPTSGGEEESPTSTYEDAPPPPTVDSGEDDKVSSNSVGIYICVCEEV